MEGIIGTLDFYAPVLVLGVVVIGIVCVAKDFLGGFGVRNNSSKKRHRFFIT